MYFFKVTRNSEFLILFRYSTKAGFRFRCITHDLFEDVYIRDNIDVYGEDLTVVLTKTVFKMTVDTLVCFVNYVQKTS